MIRVKQAAERSVSTVSNGTTLTTNSILDDSSNIGSDTASTIAPESTARRAPRTKEEIELSNLRKKTRKRTRRFEVDGVVVTTTTSKVRIAG
jgi:STE20-like kinase